MVEDMATDRPRRAENPKVAGVLLAAGGGRRLGGRPKALLEHRGRPLIEHAVRSLRNGGCGPLHVVLGAAAEEVRARADLTGCAVSVNPGWEEGMGSSLRLGLAAPGGDGRGRGARPPGRSAGNRCGGGGAGAARVPLADEPGGGLVRRGA
ncbi:MobA-like NTP transferase domain-containing protein, partial [Streptomyces sp. Ncost-T6T-2b]